MTPKPDNDMAYKICFFVFTFLKYFLNKYIDCCEESTENPRK